MSLHIPAQADGQAVIDAEAIDSRSAPLECCTRRRVDEDAMLKPWIGPAVAQELTYSSVSLSLDWM